MIRLLAKQRSKKIRKDVESTSRFYLVLLAGSPDREVCFGHCLHICGYGRVESHISLMDYSVKFQDVTIAK